MKKLLITGLCIGAAHLVAVGQDEKPAGFKNTLSAGVTLTEGNSETRQGNATVLSEGEKEGLGSVRAGVEANYGESKVAGNKETTVENARAFVNVKKTITPRTFGSLDASALYDSIAQVDYRGILALSLGAYPVKNDRTSLSAEVGPAYVWERVAGVRDDYLALRIAERFEHAVSETAKVWQSLEYLPRADNFDDYLLNVELGVEAAVNTRMNVRVVLQDKYDSTPGAGLKQNDLIAIAGLGVSL